ncbi:MAG: MauE/DoxX family redox-associated membrane protein [Actinomycetota bacterium]
MVETITPVVHGGRRSRWARSLAMHVAGATLAAAAFGAALGGAGALLGAPWGTSGPVVVATLAGLYLARETFRLRVPVPQLRRQVPDWWRTFFPFGPASFLYGVGLGVGFLTYLTHGTLAVVAAAAAAGGRPVLGALLVGPFGLARGLSAATAIRARTPEEGSALVGRLATAAGWLGWRAAHAVVLAAIVVAAVVAATEEGASEAGTAAAAVLAVAFGAAAIAKLARRLVWRRALASYRLPPPVERVSAWAVPAVELGLASLPLLGLASTAGLASLVALGCFSAAIVLGRVRVGPRVGCGCFGSASARDYRLLLGRNALLGATAAVAWRAGEDVPAIRLGMPAGDELLPAGLVLLGLALAVWAGVQAAIAVRRGAVR